MKRGNTANSVLAHLVEGNQIFSLAPEIKNQAGSQFTHRDY